MFSIILAAGWPIWPLIACSIAALAIIIERFSALRDAKVAPPQLLDEVLGLTRHGLPADDVVQKLAANSVLGTVLAAGVHTAMRSRPVQEAALHNAFENAGRLATQRMERYLNTLGTLASAAPLLGLLGTVVGMIEIFGAQTPGAADTGGTNPEQLAHGISVALYNTAFGLMIAIPALATHRYFRGKVDEYVLTIELAADRLMQQLLSGKR